MKKSYEEAFSVHKRGPEEDPYCGLPKVWTFGGLFNPCCRVHDAAYDQAIANPGTMKLSDVDNPFLSCMLKKAGNSWPSKTQAYTMYGLAHAWGATVRKSLWKKETIV
jgi:hypothetical protein